MLTQMVYTSYHCAAVQCKITATVLVLSVFVSTTDCLGPCVPNEMYFSTRQCSCPLVQPVRLDYVSTRTTRQLIASTRTTRQLIAWAPVSLMRCNFPLDKIHCRLDNACVHSYNPYDSTMLVSTRTTRQLIASTRTTRQLIAWAPVYLMRCIFSLDKIHCRLDNARVHSYNPYDSTMPVSTRTTRTTRQCLCALERLVRLDN